MPDLIGVSDSAKPAANRTYRGYRLRRGVDTAAVAEVDEPVAGDDAAPLSPSKKHQYVHIYTFGEYGGACGIRAHGNVGLFGIIVVLRT